MHAVALLLAAALAVALPASRGKADDSIRVKLITISPVDGQDDVEGTVAVKAFTVKGKHGTMEVPASRVSSMNTSSRSNQEGPILVVETTDKQRFEGVIVSPKTLEIAGKYGRFSTSWDDVHSLKVEGNPGFPDGDEDEDAPGGVWDVRIETEGGEAIGGPLWSISEGPITSVEIDCDFGSLSLDPEKVRSIHFEPGTGKALEGGGSEKSGSVLTTDGIKLSGTITIPAGWVVETDLGLLGLKAGKLKSITFNGAARLPGPRASRPARSQIPGPPPPPTPPTL
jgi:hypothetical protein